MDIDGNSYKTIGIGDQEWMAQNLATTHYNDGSAIPLETNNANWADLTTPAYGWYKELNGSTKSEYKDIYGAYYNWYAVETANYARLVGMCHQMKNGNSLKCTLEAQIKVGN